MSSSWSKQEMYNYLRDIYREDDYDAAVEAVADELEISIEEADVFVRKWLKTVIKKYSSKLEPEIFEFLDAYGGYGDYNQKVDDVSEEWNMIKDVAESYVWNWSIQVDYDEDEDDEYYDDEDEDYDDEE